MMLMFLISGDFYCDCPVSMKGKLCKHTTGMAFIKGNVEVTSEVRSVPLGQKRKRGRPKKLPNCLTRSPPVQSHHPAEVIRQVEVAEPGHVVCDVEASPVLCYVEATPVLCGVEASPVLVAKARKKRGGTILNITRPEKSAYELLREENIREREAMFESLNIEQEVASCHEGIPVKNARRGKATKRKAENPPSPRRLRSRK